MTTTEEKTDPTAPVEDISRHRVTSMTRFDVASILGASNATTLRSLIPALVADGVLRRVGRRWLGRPSDIEAWATGAWRAPREAGRR